MTGGIPDAGGVSGTFSALERSTPIIARADIGGGMTTSANPGAGFFTPIPAPDRSVCQYTGELADGLSFPVIPTSGVGELIELRTERDYAIKQRDDARAELDNMVNLTIEVGRLGNYLRHAIADRDEYRERADEWRDRFEDAQVRIDEMAAEIRELTQRLADAETARDTVSARASL